MAVNHRERIAGAAGLTAGGSGTILGARRRRAGEMPVRAIVGEGEPTFRIDRLWGRRLVGRLPIGRRPV
jgi:hypothetical protein